MKLLLAILIGVTTLMVPDLSSAAVWENKNNWSDVVNGRSYEAHFQDWIRENVNADFHSNKVFAGKPNPYYGLKPDCADAVYSVHAVFAYNNNLPFELVSSFSSKKKTTNLTTRYDGIKPSNFTSKKAFLDFIKSYKLSRKGFGYIEQGEIKFFEDVAQDNFQPEELARIYKLRMFINLIYLSYGTASMKGQSYPVAVTKEAMVPGVFGLARDGNHHAWFIKEVTAYGTPLMLQSSISKPRAFPLLEMNMLQAWNPGTYIYGVTEGKPTTKKSGYRALRRPKDLFKAEHEIAGTSYEQYDVPVLEHVSYYEEKLASADEQLGAKVERLLGGICERISERINSVESAVKHKNKINAEGRLCMSQKEHLDYSTPGRDRGDFERLIAVRRAYVKNIEKQHTMSERQKEIVNALFPFWNKSLAEETSLIGQIGVGDINFCDFDLGNGYTLSLEEYKQRLLTGQLSNSPNDSFEKRWGFVMSTPNQCPNYGETWTPDLTQVN